MAHRAGEDDTAVTERRTEVASYVASLSGDLSTLARRNGLATLAYLLDIARLEAEQFSRDGGSGPGVKLS